MSDQFNLTTPPISTQQYGPGNGADEEATDFLGEAKALLFKALEIAGITRVVINFDGCGDSGQIENIEAFAGDTAVALPDRQAEFERFAPGNSGPVPQSRLITNLLETLVYDLLGNAHGGWENNDGACGEFIFDVAERSISLDLNERYIAVEHFSYHF